MVRVFLGEELERIIYVSNGFEGMTLGEADADPDDGWYLANKNNWCGDWDGGCIGITPAEGIVSGTKAFQGFGDVGLDRGITSGKEFQVEMYFTIDSSSGGAQVGYFQLDDGGDMTVHTLIDGTTPGTKPNNGILFTISHTSDPPNLSGFSLKTRFNSTDQTELDKLVEYEITAGERIKVIAYFTSSSYRILFGSHETFQGSWSNAGTMGNLSHLKLYLNASKWYIDDVLIYTTTEPTSQEITCEGPVSFNSHANNGGSCNFRVPDKELANYSTFKDYMGWNKLWIKTNDLSEIKWAGYLAQSKVGLNHHSFVGLDPIAILKLIQNQNSTLFATGELTAIAGAVVTDANANFGADLVGKRMVFTDVAGPSTETVYPDAGSSEWEAVYDYFNENTYTILNNLTDYVLAVDADVIRYEVEISAANEDNLTSFELRCVFDLEKSDRYEDITWVITPKIEIYDHTNTTWRTLKLVTWNNFNSDFDLILTQADLPAGVVGDYFDGTHDLNIRIVSGADAATDETLAIYLIELKYIYSTEFTAEGTVYLINSVDSTTQITLHADAAAAGVAANDLYVVGDLIHNQLDDVVAESWFELSRKTSTKIDTTNHFMRGKFDVLLDLAAKAGYDFWFTPSSFRINVTDSWSDSGIDLTEAHIEGFNDDIEFLSRDATRMAAAGVAKGNGCYASVSQSTEYNALGNFGMSNPLVNSQNELLEKLTERIARLANTIEQFPITVDEDDGTDYTNLLIGKTLDLNIKLGTIQVSNLKIIGLASTQDTGEDSHLKTTITLASEVKI